VVTVSSPYVVRAMLGRSPAALNSAPLELREL
jgi:hypothetical protein